MHGKRIHCKRKLSALELQTPKFWHCKKKFKKYQTDANTSISINIFVAYQHILFHTAEYNKLKQRIPVEKTSFITQP